LGHSAGTQLESFAPYQTMAANTSSFPHSNEARFGETGAESKGKGWWKEIRAVLCAGFASLLFLALVSYTPTDLPEWVKLSQDVARADSTENFLGSWGAIAAGYIFLAFGAASFLIPAVVFWLALASLLGFRLMRMSVVTAIVALLVSAASLLELQTLVLQSWADDRQMPLGIGGISGLLFGSKFIGNLIGTVGAFMLMTAVYVLSMVVIAGFRFQFMAYRPSVPKLHPQPEVDPELEEEEAVEDMDDFESYDHVPLGPYSYDEDYMEDEPFPPVTPFTQQLSKPSADTQPYPDDEDEMEYGDELGVGVASDSDLDEVEDPLDDYDGFEDFDPPKPKPMRPGRSAFGAAQAEHDPYLDTTPIPPMKPSATAPLHDQVKPGAHSALPYELPSMELLDCAQKRELTAEDKAELQENLQIIVRTLASFGVSVRPGEITRGPTVTRYEVYPTEGLRVRQIVNLEADLARATRAKSLNILAPIPGKDTVGIEIANEERVLVPLRDLLEDPEYLDEDKRIPLALGQDVYGRPVFADLASMPHLLVAGATGSGKSVCINSIIASLLYRFSPEELRLILVDPKVVEMQVYKELPHLALPVVTDPKRVILALRWVVAEMERRYQLLAEHGCRKIDEYNARLTEPPRRPLRSRRRAHPAPLEPRLSNEHFMPEDAEEFRHAQDGEEVPQREHLPYIVIIIDELADLMQAIQVDLERSIVTLCQKARAAGIHLIIATQSPRVDVITGTIKANIPARIAFQVASMMDSRVILDKGGAEKLIGQGDMLYQPGDSAIPLRSQGAFLTDMEVDDIAEHCSSQMEPRYEEGIADQLEQDDLELEEEVDPEEEEILEKCIEVIRTSGRASTSYLQRRLRLGYNRAARMMDILEQRGIIGPADGSKPREILIDLDDDPS